MNGESYRLRRSRETAAPQASGEPCDVQVTLTLFPLAPRTVATPPACGPRSSGQMLHHASAVVAQLLRALDAMFLRISPRLWFRGVALAVFHEDRRERARPGRGRTVERHRGSEHPEPAHPGEAHRLGHDRHHRRRPGPRRSRHWRRVHHMSFLPRAGWQSVGLPCPLILPAISGKRESRNPAGSSTLTGLEPGRSSGSATSRRCNSIPGTACGPGTPSAG